MMIRRFQGVVYGNRIEVAEDMGLKDGDVVQLTVEPAARDGSAGVASVSEWLARVYNVLGERFESGHVDTAAKHNEHQP